MPANAVTSQGLTIQTLPEIISEIKNGTADYPGMYQIYGPTINVEPNSPDGQMINIVAQAKLDMLEFIQQVFTGFDPDQAVGVVLDQRCAINGVFRQAGTYTITNVDVTLSQALTLPGLDTAPIAPFTVSDTAGNKYFLAETYVGAAPGTYTLEFRAENLGPVTPIANTINVVTTITLGVAGVNNPTTIGTVVGTNEETDYALRIRRRKSVALGSQGWTGALYGMLAVIPGVTSSLILENVGNTTDANGIPGHSIWVIVDGGNTTLIGEAIYNKRNAGCGMKGDVVVPITQIDNTIFNVQFDRPINENLWISFDAVAITGVTPVDETFLRSQILAQLSYSIGQSADTTTITSIVHSVDSNVSVSNIGVSSDGVTYTSLLAPTGFNYLFAISGPRIIINGNPGT